MSGHHVRVTVNGEVCALEVDIRQRLLDVLRGPLRLTGTKEGCGIGVCGLCSVFVDGELVSACLVPAVALDGATVETVESLEEPDGTLTALQEAFVLHGAVQCGICTPGQLMTATALLRERPNPTESEVREWMSANLCRCTGYEGIVSAIRAVGAHADTT